MRHLRKYYNQCIDELENMGVSTWELPDVKLTISNRAKARFGMCYYNENGVACEINISQFLLDEKITPDENALKNTIIHEILHALYPGEGHKGEWKKMAEFVTKQSNGLYKIKRTTSYEEKGIDRSTVRPPKKIKYVVECPKCGYTWEYSRKCKTVEYASYYRCTECGVGLRLKSPM